MKHHSDILFICKKNDCYGFINPNRRSSGLFNSTHFIVKALNEKGFKAHIVEVGDNNEIDREVTIYRPRIVIVEALWVVPEKFDILKRLHPHVSWFVHLHSQVPFLAMEGIAIEWLQKYADRRIGIITNAVHAFEALTTILPLRELLYLPNVYLGKMQKIKLADKHHIDIGCFGAIRPMKNQLFQALAAISFAKEMDKPLRFHINASRVETGGEPVLKNLIQLFKETPNAVLVRTLWKEPEVFLQLLNEQIDLGMQVSLTETFNVVSADYVTAGLPIVVSKEIGWVSSESMADCHSMTSILRVIGHVWKNADEVHRNQYLLARNSENAQLDWARFVHAFI